MIQTIAHFNVYAGKQAWKTKRGIKSWMNLSSSIVGSSEAEILSSVFFFHFPICGKIREEKISFFAYARWLARMNDWEKKERLVGRLKNASFPFLPLTRWNSLAIYISPDAASIHSDSLPIEWVIIGYARRPSLQGVCDARFCHLVISPSPRACVRACVQGNKAQWGLEPFGIFIPTLSFIRRHSFLQREKDRREEEVRRSDICSSIAIDLKLSQTEVIEIVSSRCCYYFCSIIAQMKMLLSSKWISFFQHSGIFSSVRISRSFIHTLRESLFFLWSENRDRTCVCVTNGQKWVWTNSNLHGNLLLYPSSS